MEEACLCAYVCSIKSGATVGDFRRKTQSGVWPVRLQDTPATRPRLIARHHHVVHYLCIKPSIYWHMLDMRPAEGS